MNMTFKRTRVQSTLAVILLSMVVLMPGGYIFAQTEGVRSGTFCENIDTLEDRIIGNVSDRQVDFSTKHITRRDAFSAKRIERASRLSDRRAEIDATRADRYVDLRGRAETPDQVVVVEGFITIVETLLVDRRESVDIAATSFQAGLQALYEQKHSDSLSVVVDYKLEVRLLVDTAKTSCVDGGDSPQTAKALREGLNTQRAAFKSSRPQNEDVREDVYALKEVYRAQIESAKAVFQKGLMGAKDILKAVFIEG